MHQPARVHIVAVHGDVYGASERRFPRSGIDRFCEPRGKLDAARWNAYQRDGCRIPVLCDDSIRDLIDRRA
jgi:hypothetical protein